MTDKEIVILKLKDRLDQLSVHTDYCKKLYLAGEAEINSLKKLIDYLESLPC